MPDTPARSIHMCSSIVPKMSTAYSIWHCLGFQTIEISIPDAWAWPSPKANRELWMKKSNDGRHNRHTGIYYPLAYVGLARAEAQLGRTGQAKKAYEDFFALWKDAEPDVPILLEARKEYAALK